MAGRPARPPGFLVPVRSQARRRGSQESAGSDRRRQFERAGDACREHAGQEDAGEDSAREDELARLIAQVREARERLVRLIATLRAGRPNWGEREQRWTQWHRDTERRVQGNPPAPRIH
ncbi:MAG: hypothetical protein M3545_03115 [Acidobacteriota bacterium]|nr:hypothetical protein [Acidobacteriota bacterium]